MFAPSVLATAAHVLYKEEGDSSAFHDRIQIMRDPDIGSTELMEPATVIEVNTEYDVGLLSIPGEHRRIGMQSQPTAIPMRGETSGKSPTFGSCTLSPVSQLTGDPALFQAVSFTDHNVGVKMWAPVGPVLAYVHEISVMQCHRRIINRPNNGHKICSCG